RPSSSPALERRRHVVLHERLDDTQLGIVAVAEPCALGLELEKLLLGRAGPFRLTQLVQLEVAPDGELKGETPDLEWQITGDCAPKCTVALCEKPDEARYVAE